MLQPACTLAICNSSHAGSISPPVYGPSLQRICLQAVLWEKVTMSCCWVIFVVVSAITRPWFTFVVMNFERGLDGLSWAFRCYGCANSNTVCHSCACFNARCPVKTYWTQSCIMAPNVPAVWPPTLGLFEEAAALASAENVNRRDFSIIMLREIPSVIILLRWLIWVSTGSKNLKLFQSRLGVLLALAALRIADSFSPAELPDWFENLTSLTESIYLQ